MNRLGLNVASLNKEISKEAKPLTVLVPTALDQGPNLVLCTEIWYKVVKLSSVK